MKIKVLNGPEVFRKHIEEVVFARGVEAGPQPSSGFRFTDTPRLAVMPYQGVNEKKPADREVFFMVEAFQTETGELFMTLPEASNEGDVITPVWTRNIRPA